MSFDFEGTPITGFNFEGQQVDEFWFEGELVWSSAPAIGPVVFTVEQDVGGLDTVKIRVYAKTGDNFAVNFGNGVITQYVGDGTNQLCSTDYGGVKGQVTLTLDGDFEYFTLYDSGSWHRNKWISLDSWGGRTFSERHSTNADGMFRNITSLERIADGPVTFTGDTLEKMFDATTLTNTVVTFSGWSTSGATSMRETFDTTNFGDKAFDLSPFNTASVIDFTQTLYNSRGTAQLTGIESWNTGSAISMVNTLSRSTYQPTSLAGWNMANVDNGTGFMGSTQFRSTVDYDASLAAWAAGSRSGATMNFGNSQYTDQVSRDICSAEWVISDGGLAEPANTNKMTIGAVTSSGAFASGFSASAGALVPATLKSAAGVTKNIIRMHTSVITPNEAIEIEIGSGEGSDYPAFNWTWFAADGTELGTSSITMFSETGQINTTPIAVGNYLRANVGGTVYIVDNNA